MNDFVSIYREFQPRVQRYLSHLAGEADAADLTQTVFLTLFSMPGRGRS